MSSRQLRVRLDRTIYALEPIGYGGVCVYCLQPCKPSEGVKMQLPDNVYWVHNYHNNSDVNCYSFGDNPDDIIHVGKQVKSGLEFGIELEVNSPSDRVALEGMAYLVRNHFTPTSDCTVGIEFKSPLYHSCNSFAKVASGIEELNRTSREDYAIRGTRFTTKCSAVGAHLNISTPFIRTAEGYDFIRHNKRELFEKLEEYIRGKGDAWQREFFGRAIGAEWAIYNEDCNWNINAHRAWINTEIKSSNRLEFRVCKFMSANQYIKLVRVFSEVCLQINEHSNGDTVLRSFVEACNKFNEEA